MCDKIVMFVVRVFHEIHTYLGFRSAEISLIRVYGEGKTSPPADAYIIMHWYVT